MNPFRGILAGEHVEGHGPTAVQAHKSDEFIEISARRQE